MQNLYKYAVNAIKISLYYRRDSPEIKYKNVRQIIQLSHCIYRHQKIMVNL